MTVRAVEGKQPYTGGTAIEIDENKVISLRLRDENNLIIYDAGDNEIYVDLQLPDELTPTDAFPVGITTGRVIVDNGWDLQGTLICAKTTSGDNIKVLYADEGTLWIDNGTGTFKQIYFKADVDGIITTLTTYINGELAKKQNGVTSDTAPSNPSEGDLWYDTTSNTLKVYNGSSWVATGGGGGSGDVVVSTDTGNELSTGVALWFGTETDYSSISTPDTNTLYIQYKSDGGGWTPGANTIAYYPLDSTNTVNDLSGNNHTLTNSGITFGTYNGVDCAYNAGSNYMTGSTGTKISDGSYTLNVWAYKNGGVREIYVMMFGTGTTYSATCMQRGSSGIINYACWFDDISTISTYPTGAWTNIVFTYDKDTRAKHIYVNGADVSSGTGSSGYNLTNANFGIFSDYMGANDYFYGNLSNFIIEDKARTAQEISDYYNQTKSNYGIS